MTWKYIPLGELITLQRGYDLPEQSRHDGTVPIVTSSGITGYHNVAMQNSPGVVTGRYGTIGEVHYVNEDYWPHNTTLFVKDFKGNNPKFVRYLLVSLNLAHQVSSGAVPGVNRNTVHEMRVPDIPVNDQSRIAETLCAYDDLIENNRRRITLLEESARQLYREWFVRLKFPGHEHTRIVDGIPEGCERKTLGDLCDDIRDNVSPENLEADTPYIGLEHIPRRSISLSNWGNVEDVTSSKLLFREGDILFGKIRPYFHKVGVAFIDGVASSDTIILRPAKEIRSLILMTVSSDAHVAFVSQTVREGSKMPRADWNMMKTYPVVMPTQTILSTFDSLVTSITGQLRTLTFQIQKLQTARDLLLPKLMRGEIVV